MTSPARRIMLRSILLSIFCIFAASLHAQDAPDAKSDYSKESFVIRRIVNKVKFENDGTYTTAATLEVHIQSAAGVQAWGVVQLPYASNAGDAAIGFVKVTKPDGTIVNTPLDNIQDLPAPITTQAPLYSDLKIKQLAVKGLGAGDTLEYEESVHIKNPLIAGQFWFERNFFKNGIVLDEQLEIRVPRDRYVKVQSPGLAPVTSDENGYRLYLWKTANLERPSEEATPKAPGKSPAPDVQITSFHNWDEIAHWYQQLETSRIASTPEIKAKAEELTRDAASDNEKVRLLYNYVATKFRYIGVAFGIGRYQPHAAADVLTNGYGDCKDKHTLLASLLAASGVHSYAVLINSTRKIDPDVPSPGQFDHVITAIPQGKDLLWLDGTEEVAPVGYLLPILRDKQALAVPDDGPGQLVRTPPDPPFSSSLAFKIDGKLGSDSTLDGKVDSSFRGDVEFLLRVAFRSTPEAQWKDVAQAIARLWNFSGSVSDVQVSSPEATDAAFSLKYGYNRKDYPNWPDALRPPVPPINFPKLGDDDKSTEPIHLDSPGEYLVQANIELPKNVTAKPHAAVDVTQDFAEYHASYSWESGVFHIQRRLIVHMRELPRSRADDYRAFWKTVSDDGDVIVPVSSSGPASEKESAGSAESVDARADGLLDLADSLFRQSNYDDAIAQYRKVIALRPDDVRAHRTLADALLDKSDFSGAAAEYRETLRISPGDNRVHSALAEALIAQNDLDGAATEYRTVLRSNPDDADAHYGLGSLFLQRGQTQQAIDELKQATASQDHALQVYSMLGASYQFLRRNDEAIEAWTQVKKLNPGNSDPSQAIATIFIGEKRYADAIAELQPSIEKNPQDASLPFLLGKATLGTGDSEKSMVAFKKAMELDSRPNMLNNVGWELADANVRLEDALNYAKQAVQQEEDKTADIYIESLKRADLAAMRALTAYWDTLGWVYYRMGRMEEAEKYLSAAWKLGQSPSIGDHLGLVYEKHGKKDQAISIDKMTLATGHAPPETTARLSALLGEKPNDRLINLAADDLTQLRTIRLPRLVKGSAHAEFFVIVTPGAGITKITFIKGSDGLRLAGSAIASAHYEFASPDNRPVKLIRRGILDCPDVGTGCEFVLLPLESVNLLN